MDQQQRGIIFTSRTIMGRDEASKVQQLLQTLLNSSDSIVFRDPVDWQGLNLMDYPLIIKKPMDLLTVKKKMACNNYQNVEDSLEDINQIWQNAKVYNPKQNEIHKLADKLEKQTKKMVKNYLPFVRMENTQSKKKTSAKKQIKNNSKQGEQPKPKTYLQKQQQAKNQQQQNQASDEPQHVVARKNLLYLIQLCSKEQIGVLFQMIHKNCREALQFDEDGEVTVRGQKLDDNIVKRLNNLMEMWGINFKTAAVAPTKKK